MFNGIGEFIAGLVTIVITFFILGFIWVIFTLKSCTDKNIKIESKTPPIISWELKANGQHVDTT